MAFYTIKMAFQTENAALILMFELPRTLASPSVYTLKNFLILLISVLHEVISDFHKYTLSQTQE